MRRQAMPPTRGVFPPRAVAFCRGIMTAVFTTLSLAGLILLIAGLLVVQSMRPGFGQEPRELHTLRPSSAAHTASVTPAVVALPPRSGV